MRKKLTILEMQNIALQRGGWCLSTEYVNAKTKLWWQCKNGHIWNARPDNIKQNEWCPYCINRYKIIEDMQELAKNNEGECLSNKYINNHTKLQWKCKYNHIWESIPNNILRGTWCPICAGVKRLTLKDMQIMALKREGYCLSNEYINNATELLWQCKNEHIWKAKPRNIHNGQWCPQCHDNKISNYLNLTLPLIHFLDGELLGDGSLSMGRSKSSAYFKYGTSKKEYLIWLMDILREFGLNFLGENKIYIQHRKKDEKIYKCFHAFSKSYRDLLTLYKRWYPEGKKIVPSDIELMPITIRQWYIGDGCLVRERKKGKFLKVKLYSLGFGLEYNKLLQEKLKEIGISSKIYKAHFKNYNKDYYYQIVSCRKNVKIFFDYIGECPTELKNVYGYKWPTKNDYKWLEK